MDDQSQGFTRFLVIMDVSSGFIILRPLQNQEAETIARELFDVFCLIGFPPILSSDRGPDFRNQVLKRLNEILNIEHRFTTPYNPQANGKVERGIGTIKSSLIKVLNETNQLWPQALSFVQFCYNRKIQSLTNISPYYMMFGRDLYDLYGRVSDSDHSFTKERLPEMEEAKLWKEYCEKVLALLYPAIELRSRHIKEEMIQRLSEIRKRVIQDRLPIGTHVLLLDPKFLGDKNRKKLTKTTAPYLDNSVYEIIQQSTDGSYKVKNEIGLVLERSVPIWQMKILDYPHQKYYERPQLYKEDEYEVSWIEDDRINPITNQKEYLTHWKGWSTPTWELASHFEHAKAIVDDYEQNIKHSSKIKDKYKKLRDKSNNKKKSSQHVSNNPASSSVISTSSKHQHIKPSTTQQRLQTISSLPPSRFNTDQQKQSREQRFQQRNQPQA
jgi:transposase InsO family protein